MKHLKLFENSAALAAVENELIRPGVFHIDDSATTEYFGYGFDFRINKETSNDTQFTFTINDKRYQTTSTEISTSSSEKRYHTSLNGRIGLKPDGALTISNVATNDGATSTGAAFSFIGNNDYNLRIPLEMQDYLSENTDIDINNLSTEQMTNMVKAIGMCPVGGYSVYMFYGDCSEIFGDECSDLKPKATFKPLFSDEYLTCLI